MKGCLRVIDRLALSASGVVSCDLFLIEHDVARSAPFMSVFEDSVAGAAPCGVHHVLFLSLSGAIIIITC